MTSHSGIQIIAINIHMKFGLLIEHSMRNIFLEKSYPKCGRETRPTPFSFPISLDQ